MTIKKKLSKKFLIPMISSLILGLSLGSTSASTSQDDLKKAELKNSQIETEISSANSQLEIKKNELSNLQLKVNDLEQQKEIIDTKIKEKQESQAKAQEVIKAQEAAKVQTEAQTQVKAKSQNTQSSSNTNSNTNNTGGSNGSGGGGSSGVQATESKVWKTSTGKKYHRTNHCGKTNSSNATLITLQQAKNLGLTPCQKCY